MVIGDNGILKRATEAKEKSVIGEEIEQTSIAYDGAYLEKEGNGVVTDADVNAQLALNGINAMARGANPIRVVFNETGHEYAIKGGKVEYVGAYVKPEETPSDFFTWEENEDGTITITGIIENTSTDENGMGWYYTVSTDTVISETEIVFPSIINGKKVTNIGSNVFSTNRSGARRMPVKSVVLSEGIENIDYEAFYLCEELESIALPESLLKIDSNAFVGCSKLTSITIPEKISRIEPYTFSRCNELENITISNKNATIGALAFENTKWYNNQANGIVYINKTLYHYKGDMPDNTEIIIPDNIEEISGYAFENYENLKSIVIPEGVPIIHWATFMGCSNLTNVTLPNSLTNIEWAAFRYCGSLNNIILPENLEVIDSCAFADCKKLANIVFNNKLIGICNASFHDCELLNNITIPNTVEYIEPWSFANCTSLKTVNYNGTMEEWNSIDIGVGYSSEDYYLKNARIVCTDGVINE